MSPNKIASNFFWRLFERCGSEGITFVVSIILARLLEPKAYGTLALIYVFTSILDVFINSGLGTALIQKKDADDIDFSTVFYFNILIAIISYILIFIGAPYISDFYRDASMTPYIRVLSLALLLSGIKNVQYAYISRNLMFKVFFFATLAGTLFSAIIGIAMAYKGFGIWALIAQRISTQVVSTALMWGIIHWTPRLVFSWNKLKSLYQYGWKMLASALLNTVYMRFHSLIIGKIYSAEELAYFHRGENFPIMIASNLNNAIDSVLFPAMSQVQDNLTRLKDMTRNAIKLATYIIMPAMACLAVCSEPLVKLILTDKWLPCLPFLRLYCISLAFYPIHTANLNAIKALGRSDIFLVLEIIKKIVGLAVLILCVRKSMLMLAYGSLVSSIMSQIINSWPNKKLLNYSYLNQIYDIFPSILLTFISGSVAYSICLFMKINYILMLLLQPILLFSVYMIMSIITHNDSMTRIIFILKSLIKH